MLAHIKKYLIGLFIVALFLLAGWIDIFSSRNNLPATTASTSSTSKLATSAPTPALPSPAPKPVSQWDYMQHNDEMSNGVIYAAFLKSTNTVEFASPYSDPQHALLTIRTHPRYAKDVILRIERGQFLCNSYENCTVLVRFDDQEPQKYTARGPSDHSTTSLYISDYSRFIASMLKAKQVRMSAKVYQEGQPVFVFDVNGFDASKYKPKH